MKRLLFILLAFFAVQLNAQDLPHFKRIVGELSSARYQGRGYARGGANKAGKYLEKEFRKAGVDEVTLQPFTIDINTFPGAMEMWADGRKLEAGVDFSMREYSPGVKGEFPVYRVDTLNFDGSRLLEDLARPENAGCLVCCDFWFTYTHRAVFSKLQKAGVCPNAGLLYTWTAPIKFFKAYGEKVVDKPIIWVTPEAIDGVKRVKVNVENEFLKGYELFNVIAKVEGEKHDSCYVFTAHYDHLGNLGRKVYYPGANDNASGTAAIVTLAAHYAKNKPEYDMYFLAFSGEDANIRGSTYFADHPVVPLKQIKYLFNIDMIGDDNPVQYCEVSDAGMSRYGTFEKVNAQQHLFKALNRGALAANSDHYPFAVRGVPCIFLENQEGSAFPHYHTPADNLKTIRWDSYEPVFKLVTGFIETKFPAVIVSVRDFGARGDGASLDTEAIQAAIDSVAKTGGVVRVPAGTYLCGSIWLRSNVDLHLEEGAVIKGSSDIKDYCSADCCPQNEAEIGFGDYISGGHLLLGVGVENVCLSGPGKIDGNSDAFILGPDGKAYKKKSKIPARPSQMVWFVDSKNITIRDIELADSPYWSCFILNCEEVNIDNCYVHTRRKDYHTFNGDGLDIDRCRNVTISNCRIDTSDDCITLRASCAHLLENPQDCEGVRVRNCKLSSSCNAIRVGVGEGHIHDAVLSDISISDTKTAFNIVGSYAGEHGTDIDDILFENITVQAKDLLRIHHMRSKGCTIKDISFRNISGTAPEDSHIWAKKAAPFKGIVLQNVAVPAQFDRINAKVKIRRSLIKEKKLSSEEEKTRRENIEAEKKLLY